MLSVNRLITKVETNTSLIRLKLETNVAFVLTNDERKTVDACLASA